MGKCSLKSSNVLKRRFNWFWLQVAEWAAAGCRTYSEYVAYREGQELVSSPSFVRNEPTTVLSQSSSSVPLRQNRVQKHELFVRHEYQHQHLHHHYHHVPPTAINANISVTVNGSDGLTGSNVTDDAGLRTVTSPATNTNTGRKRNDSNSKSSKAKRAKTSATGFRAIELPGPPFRLEIREEDVREPPPLAPYSDNIERLFEEWYDCGLLVIRNVRVPVSCWAEVYRGSPWYEGKRKFWAECKVRKKRTRYF
jgi:hypothetical protein